MINTVGASKMLILQNSAKQLSMAATAHKVISCAVHELQLCYQTNALSLINKLWSLL